MPTLANLSLQELSTTTARVFSGSGVNALGVAKWVNRTSGKPQAYQTITQSLREPKGSNRNYKATLKLQVPVTYVDTTTGQTVKASEMTAVLECVFDENTTPTQRGDLLNYVAKAISDTGAPFKVAVVDTDQTF